MNFCFCSCWSKKCILLSEILSLNLINANFDWSILQWHINICAHAHIFGWVLDGKFICSPFYVLVISLLSLHGRNQSRADVPEDKVQGRAAGGRGLRVDDKGQKVIRMLSAPSGWVDLLLGGFILRRSFLSPSLLTGPDSLNAERLKDTAVV